MKKFKTQTGVDRSIKFLEHVAARAWGPLRKNESGFAKATPYHGEAYDREARRLSTLWEAIASTSSAFITALHHGKTLLPPGTAPSKAPHGGDVGTNHGWLNFELDAIADIVASDAISSVADAAVKTTAFLSVLASSSSSHGRYAFRGQTDIRWPLVSRFGRLAAAPGSSSAGDFPRNVTTAELEALAAFRRSWPPADADLLDHEALSEHDAAWWGRMQHYDAGDGTRLLDVTSSLFFALLFACVRWSDGKVADQDEDGDGVLYCFIEGSGTIVQDFALEAPPPADSLFDALHDVPCLVLNPPHNERSKAQGGAFLWWPRFWEPLESGVQYFRVPKQSKRAIAKELLALGVGPKEAVRGKAGLRNESTLRADLGLRAWNPRGLL